MSRIGKEMVGRDLLCRSGVDVWWEWCECECARVTRSKTPSECVCVSFAFWLSSTRASQSAVVSLASRVSVRRVSSPDDNFARLFDVGSLAYSPVSPSSLPVCLHRSNQPDSLARKSSSRRPLRMP